MTVTVVAPPPFSPPIIAPTSPRRPPIPVPAFTAASGAAAGTCAFEGSDWERRVRATETVIVERRILIDFA